MKQQKKPRIFQGQKADVFYYSIQHVETSYKKWQKTDLIENFFCDITRNGIMSKEQDKLKKKVKEHSKNLSSLGKELSDMKFNYKVLDKTDNEYWKKRIEEYNRYSQKVMEYYSQAHALMNIVEKEKSDMFLLNISKLRQLGVKLLDLLEQVGQNPSIMAHKDRQQSKWSKDLKEHLIEYSNKMMEHEKYMSTNFREFYERHTKYWSE